MKFVLIKKCVYRFVFSERAKQALWFAETFGLHPQSITFRTDSGRTVETPVLSEDAEESEQLGM